MSILNLDEIKRNYENKSSAEAKLILKLEESLREFSFGNGIVPNVNAAISEIESALQDGGLIRKIEAEILNDACVALGGKAIIKNQSGPEVNDGTPITICFAYVNLLIARAK